MVRTLEQLGERAEARFLDREICEIFEKNRTNRQRADAKHMDAVIARIDLNSALGQQ